MFRLVGFYPRVCFEDPHHPHIGTDSNTCLCIATATTVMEMMVGPHALSADNV